MLGGTSFLSSSAFRCGTCHRRSAAGGEGGVGRGRGTRGSVVGFLDLNDSTKLTCICNFCLFCSTVEFACRAYGLFLV